MIPGALWLPGGARGGGTGGGAREGSVCLWRLRRGGILQALKGGDTDLGRVKTHLQKLAPGCNVLSANLLEGPWGKYAEPYVVWETQLV